MLHEFDGTEYDKLRDMQAARHAKYLELVRGGMNFAKAARATASRPPATASETGRRTPMTRR